MKQRVVAVVIGLAVSFGIIFLMESLTSKLYPAPAETDFHDPESVKAMMTNMHTGAFLMILVGYAIACYIGGLVGSLISGRQTAAASLIIGCLVLVGRIMNIVSIPGHPTWFIVTSMLIYIPFAYFGHLQVRRRLK